MVPCESAIVRLLTTGSILVPDWADSRPAQIVTPSLRTSDAEHKTQKLTLNRISLVKTPASVKKLLNRGRK